MKKIKSNKFISRFGIVLIVISIIVACIYIFGYFAMKRDLEYRVNFSKSDVYYAYDADRKLDVIYGVRLSKEIVHLLDYYNWKLYGKEYVHGDVSIIRDLPNNTIVYAQKYVKDSTVVYVAFKHYNTYRKDSVTWNYYIPKSMLHKEPLNENQNKTKAVFLSAAFVLYCPRWR